MHHDLVPSADLSVNVRGEYEHPDVATRGSDGSRYSLRASIHGIRCVPPDLHYPDHT